VARRCYFYRRNRFWKKQDLRDFVAWLVEHDPGKSLVTLNRVLSVGITALRWVYENNIIKENIADGVVEIGTFLYRVST
jgi:hypothetical protein